VTRPAAQATPATPGPRIVAAAAGALAIGWLVLRRARR
jgi:MYXO-CTERM domain-containing protein